MIRLWMLCYDITDDRARRDIEQILLGVGERVQESVFECYLTPATICRLLDRLDSLLDTTVDSLRAYPVCAWCEGRVDWVGLGRRADDPDLWII